MAAPNLDHPTLARVKSQFPNAKLRATEYAGQTTLIVEPSDLHAVMQFLRDDPECDYNFLSDVVGVDYMDYPSETIGRFGVSYNLCSYARNDRMFVKTFLDPSMSTEGTDEDPALELDSVCDIWPGAEWTEREVFDMFGIRFRNHPDLRRILLWESYPAHPLRKDYPLRGQGEREHFRVVGRSDA
ncbi:MAG: NADH-quinone oxidoreductase subunit C [Planctomycetota bacterium]